jgi:septum formation inhibitor-activating ATPase MinD
VVPEDEMVPLAAARGNSIITVSRRGAAQAYYRIAKRITGQRVPLKRL